MLAIFIYNVLYICFCPLKMSLIAVGRNIDRSSKRMEAELGRWAPGGAVQPPLLSAVA